MWCACARDKKFKALSVREFNTIKRLHALQHKHIQQSRAGAPLCALAEIIIKNRGRAARVGVVRSEQEIIMRARMWIIHIPRSRWLAGYFVMSRAHEREPLHWTRLKILWKPLLQHTLESWNRASLHSWFGFRLALSGASKYLKFNFGTNYN